VVTMSSTEIMALGHLGLFRERGLLMHLLIMSLLVCSGVSQIIPYYILSSPPSAARIGAVMSMPPIVIAAIFAFGKLAIHKKCSLSIPRRIFFLANLIILYLLFALLLGLLRRNEAVYACGDFYAFSVLPLVLIILAVGFNARFVYKCFYAFIIYLTTQQAFIFFEFLQRIIDGRNLHISPGSPFLIFGMLFLLGSSIVTNIWVRHVLHLIVIANLLLVIASGFRTAWIAVTIGLILWFYFERRKALKVVRQLSVIGLLLVGIVLVSSSLGSSRFNESLRAAGMQVADKVRMLVKWDIHQDWSLWAKLIEGKIIIDKFSSSHNPLELFVGFGLGATYKVPSQYAWMFTFPMPNSNEVHAVHNLLFNIGFRTGLVGLLLYMGSAFQLFMYIWREVRLTPKQNEKREELGTVILRTAVTAILMSVISAVSGSGVLYNINFWLMLSLALMIAKRRKCQRRKEAIL